MLKVALLCSAIFTAFVVGDRTSVAQDALPRVVKPVCLQGALKQFVGKDCYAHSSGSGMWFVSLQKRFAKTRRFKFDMLGVDFIRLSNKEGKIYIPFDSIGQLSTD
jgi:hypothetical protein